MNTIVSSGLGTVTASDIASPARISGRRNAKPEEAGETGESAVDTEDSSIIWYWDEDEEDWVNHPVSGSTKIEGGITYVYEGTYPYGNWVALSDQSDPNAPLGDIPWWLFAFLTIGYSGFKIHKKRVIY